MEAMKKLAEGGMIDPAQLQQLADSQLSPEDIDQLMEMLEGMCGEGEGGQPGMDAKELVELWSKMVAGGKQEPGAGGISRGRGDAPMTWQDQTQTGGEKFKPVVIPPGGMDPSESQVTGISKTDPSSQEPGGPSESGALTNSKAGGGSGVTRRLLPKHRQAVSRYFERDKPK